jgi:malate dehydrogenase (oxaloacetate-decarboxylating)(NADP+)
MEGKALLFKRFADLDCVDIEVDANDPKDFIDTVARIADSFGGINIEDVAAPQCFEIEAALRARCKVPVFHDDQHGTAICVVAGLLNALEIQGKKLADVRVVCLGSGAAGTATLRLLRAMGAPIEHLTAVDRQGVMPRRTRQFARLQSRIRAPHGAAHARRCAAGSGRFLRCFGC